MGDIGDVDLQLPGAIRAAVLADKDGVVEILGGLAVDGDDRQVAKVAAAGNFLLIQMGDGAGLVQNIGRENMRQMMLADDDFHVHAEIVFAAQNLDDAAAGGTARA